jgi:hypothetical protein
MAVAVLMIIVLGGRVGPRVAEGEATQMQPSAKTVERARPR